MISASTALAVFGLATLGRSHMIMNTPIPYGHPDSSPLSDTGSDFPCKLGNGFVVETLNVMPLGSTQPLKFTGSAVHGGGSCQISITYDATPSKSSVFKVIHSIEGGCPARNSAGNNADNAAASDPDTYTFPIPDTLPTGNATLAWTWFNKIGNREIYMNCAPISLTSATTKRQEIVERDLASYNALPNMFVANIPSISGACSTNATVDTLFPQPGDSVDKPGLQANYGAPVGCTLAAYGGSVAGSVATTAAAAVGVSTTAVATQATTTAVALSGGVFATVATSAAAKPTTTAVNTVAPIATSAPASASAPKASVASTVSSAAVPAATGTSGTGSAITAGTACTTEGMWNCIGGTSFQQCASGQWSAVQELAAGTTCTSGQTTNINIVAIGSKKREARRSRHVRRHMHTN